MSYGSEQKQLVWEGDEDSLLRQPFSSSLVPHLSFFHHFYWMSTFLSACARRSFADKPRLHSKVSACWSSCIFALPHWAAACLSSHHCRCRHGIRRDTCLGASSPVAPCFHVICCNSADQLKRLRHFGTLQCQSGAVRPPALQPPLPSVYLGLPAERNSFLPPVRVFYGRVAELAHGSFLYPPGRH